jgi:hypothetical protein
MGYLVTAHIFREKPDVSRLAELPKTIGYRVYLHRAANLYLLDNFRPTKVPQYPFQTLLPTADIPLELPPGLETVEGLYARLGPLNLANGLKKSYVNAALLLNRLLQMPVFSFASNDDELDFTCSVANGALSRLKCRCGDLMISYHDGKVQIAPLVPAEGEGDEDLLTDVSALTAALPDVEVLPRETPWSTQLHSIAIEELQSFAGINETILGLGSFDPPDDEAEWELVASR